MGSLSPSLWVLLLLCNSIFFPVGCLNEEGAALFSFKEAIFDDPEGSLTNWNHSHQDPCSWNGIECEQGTVISISLPNKKLSGSLPPSLGSLSSLRHFNLRSNRLHGLLSPELFNGRSLQSLVLYGNSFSGSLPPEIGNLNFLQKLDLSQNLLSGAIPSRLIQCKRLKTLDLSSNNFSSPLPVGFGSSLIALERLNLSYNRLNGSIPGDVGNLSSLQTTADFSHNLFSGPIPENLGNLPEKVYINLAYNHLSGLIPQSGALVNRGPTAFIGNPGLCGPPLKNPCSSGVSATGPFLPSNYTPPVSEADDNASGRSNGKSLSNTSVIAIVVGDVIAIGTIAMVFFYCYSRAVSKKGKRDGRNCDKECACFRKERSESVSENEDRFDLVPLDREVGFDLDELLKASAFVLGKSGIGIVYKVVLGDGVTLAVRRLGEGGVQRFKEFRAEVEAIGKVRNQNIVTLRAYYWSVDEKLLVYDYIPNGNVSEAIHGRAGSVEFSPLSWNSRLKIIRGTAKGLASLHDFSPKKYVHGDLEPNNILLGLDMEPYISDFGLARLANIANGSPMLQSDRIATDLKPESTTINRGSCYQAPEVLKALKPSQKWDVYSFGVILLEMITGRSPLILLEDSEMDLVRWVGFCIEEKKPLSDVLDPFLAREIDREDEIISVLKIALACVQENPDKRPAMRHIVDALDRIMARVVNTREASKVL